MKHERRIPAWLLRDLPALAGLLAQLWLFVWPLIEEGFRLMRGEKLRARVTDRLAQLLRNAEATLAYALWREAYRRLGYNPRLVTQELADLPASHAELMDRIESYLDQVQNLSRAAAYYTEQLRRQVGAVPATHASTGARPRRAAHPEAVGVAAASCGGARPSTCRAEAQLRQDHAGVLANARGPPLAFIVRNQPNLASAPARLRPRPRAPS